MVRTFEHGERLREIAVRKPGHSRNVAPACTRVRILEENVRRAGCFDDVRIRPETSGWRQNRCKPRGIRVAGTRPSEEHPPLAEASPEATLAESPMDVRGQASD